MSEPEKAQQAILEGIYNRAYTLYQAEGVLPELPKPSDAHCQAIIDAQERNRGVIAVLITLLIKKLHDPNQDIRQHQVQLPGGFSGRRLDNKVVTPFLHEHNFPFMKAGSGWLTRSLEQARPYDLNYPGSIRPRNVKTAFLNLIDQVQEHGLSAENVLLNIFAGLIRYRDRNTNLILARPVNLSILETVNRINRHHSVQLPGVSRLPVLAVYSMLRLLVQEIKRYRGCTLLPLADHLAADRQTNLIGDVHITDATGALFEGYELKHGIPITSSLIRASFEKLRNTPVKRFYILTTYQHASYAEFSEEIRQVAQAHGCQLIVNGVDATLLYYLRLINDTSRFVNEYVSNLETDASVPYQLRRAWNEIITQGAAPDGQR